MTTPRMPRTCELLEEHFHSDLCFVITSYAQSVKRDWIGIGFAGEYETCMSCPLDKVNECLLGACIGGHIELANLLIAKRVENLNSILGATGLMISLVPIARKLAELLGNR